MTYVTLTSPDQHTFQAYFAAASEPDAPGLVLIQEIFGVTPSLCSAADRWASLGYNVVVPDLFSRVQAGIQLDPTVEAEFARGIQLMQSMNESLTLGDLETARQWLQQKIGHERIASLGFCWGGRLAVGASVATKMQCHVSYYGVGLEQLIPMLPSQTAPVLLHIAELDPYVPEAVRGDILNLAQQHSAWESFVYAGCDHAFARPGGVHRNESAAQLAEERSLAFLKKHTG